MDHSSNPPYSPLPRRSDLDSILILGSGPIIIGQACEFDYSGTQAVRALKEEGYRVVLVNSNPATIMTDPDLADRTYIEPLTPNWVERVIEREKPDALLPTMGGQTALNIAMELDRQGVLEKHAIELIGANARSIRMAEDREEFAAAMARIGLELPHGGFARTMDEAMAIVEDTGYPAIIRPSFTLGGTGGGIAYNVDEFKTAVGRGLDASPITEVLIDRSVIGWKEYELEVVRDASDNVIIVCSIENFDPDGSAHGGLDYGGSRPNAHGRRVSAHAGRGHRDHPRDRCRGRGLQHPVLRESADGRNAHRGDEPEGFPLLRARL